MESWVLTIFFIRNIPLAEYKKLSKNKAIQKSIHKVLRKDPRQTGSNIARLIIVENKVQALNLQLSTLTIYTRENLREMIDIKEDYCWCYLDKIANKYLLMTDEEVAELRSLFNLNSEEEENIITKIKEGLISARQGQEAIGKIRINNIVNGMQEYYKQTQHYPIKVPVYVRVKED